MRSYAAACLAASACAALASGIDARASTPRYAADPAHSRLEFYGVQAGASFKSVFHKFSAVIEFAPDALGASKFDVQIDLNSLDSGDKDRDDTMRGPDIFDVAHTPTAHYLTRSFAKTANGYLAQGALTLRGVTKDVPIEFTFKSTPAGTTLEGAAKLKRLDFGVGQGEWKSTQMVGDEVKVSFSLILAPKP